MTDILRSLPRPSAVATIVQKHYGLDVNDCVLVRSLVNDVYTVSTPDRRYVLKLYAQGRWTPDEVAWEVEFAQFLDASGIPVAVPVPLQDGSLAGAFDAPEGLRPFGMSEYVQGAKPAEPFDAELYYEFGVLVARMHAAGQSFRSSRARRDLNDVGRPDGWLTGRPEAALVDELYDEAHAQVARLATEGLTGGVRHGDVSLDNIHRTVGGLTIHDFDLATPGWTAADLTGCLSTPFAADFEKGYTSVRPITDADRAALPWFRVLGLVQNLRFHLVDKVALRGSESAAEGWAEHLIDSLRALAAQLL